MRIIFGSLIAGAILAVVIVILANLHNSVQDPEMYWDAPGPIDQIDPMVDPTETPQPVVAHQANQTTYMMRYSDVNGTYYLHPLEQ